MTMHRLNLTVTEKNLPVAIKLMNKKGIFDFRIEYVADDVETAFKEAVANALKTKPGKTETELAVLLGKGVSSVSKFVTGKRRIRLREVPIICRYLEIDPPSFE